MNNHENHEIGKPMFTTAEKERLLDISTSYYFIFFTFNTAMIALINNT